LTAYYVGHVFGSINSLISRPDENTYAVKFTSQWEETDNKYDG
jgi:hypothetical protein